MEKICQAMGRLGHTHLNADELSKAVLSDKRIASFIAEHGLTEREIRLSLPKFNQYLVETQRFVNQEASYSARGYEPILVMNEGYADVSYRETAELKEQQHKKAVEDRVQLVSLPKSYKHISFDDVHLDDTKRLAIFDYLVDFVADYPAKRKGLYLYGDMGIGKSFLLAAMAHELSEKKAVSTTILHYPSFTIDVKNAINSGSVKEEIDAVKKAEVLILDDIGAEQSSSWVRDDVLQVILQHRMLEELPTFFTSNYNFANLEVKLAQGKSGDESWQAKRVMERIRTLADEFHLEGENRR